MSFKSMSCLAASVAVMFAVGATQSFAKTKAECEEMFAAADTDHDGSLSQHEDKKWEERISHMSSVKKKDMMVIPKDVYLDECQKGSFDNM